jgi:hypothetical protein
MTAIGAKPASHTDDGNRQGTLVAIVLAEPARSLAVALCVTTETARALDPRAL